MTSREQLISMLRLLFKLLAISTLVFISACSSGELESSKSPTPEPTPTPRQVIREATPTVTPNSQRVQTSGSNQVSESDGEPSLKITSVIINPLAPDVSDVREWQELLVANGYQVTVDGVWGTNTHEATILFQKNSGIYPALGVVDSKTWAEATDLPPPPTPTPTPEPAKPRINISCPTDFSENWQSVRVPFGYSYWPSDKSSNTKDGSTISQIKIDYGDGRSYTSYSFADVEKNLFWHRYYSPGSFDVNVTYKLTNGMVDTAQCSFLWQRPYNPPATRYRVGAICRDGWRSYATGSGACSWHGGVAYWLYN
tara:strand:- start:144 stop:1079 length:936 start_codon:yes stop_codon:yes gene_type:complete